jgi:hypothetical protein
MDLVLAGNLHDMEAETIRNDAAIGIWMRGDGRGNFESVPFKKSGLFIDGDIRVIDLLNKANEELLICAKNNTNMQFIKISNKLNNEF